MLLSYAFLVDFAELIAFQIINNMPVPRVLISSKRSVAVGLDFRQLKERLAAGHDVCDNFFAVLVIWDCKDAGLLNVHMLQQRRLDFQRADLIPALLDDVL